MTDWTSFGLADRPPMSARTPVSAPSPLLAQMIASLSGVLDEPLVGITADGTIRPGLFPLTPTGASTAPVLEAAQRLLGELDAETRQRLVFPLDAPEKRSWFNIHPNVFRHGLLLEALTPAQRQAALDVMAASLSPDAYLTGPRGHAAERLPGGVDGQDRGLRGVALLLLPVREPVGRRAVGLADRRPPPEPQRPGAGRPARADPQLHGVRAVLDPRGPQRRPVDLRPRGTGRAQPDPLARQVPSRPGRCSTRRSPPATSRPS